MAERAQTVGGFDFDEEEDAAFDRAMAKLRARGLFSKTKTLTKEFDPGQPRDEGGKWTSDGGGGGPQPPPPPKGTGATLANLKIAPKASYKRAAERNTLEWLEQAAKERDITPEQAQRNIEDNMQRLLDGAELKMRLPFEAIGAVLGKDEYGGGSFKNQLETGTSLGYIAEDERRGLENDAFGSRPDADHPKYAYMDNPSAPNTEVSAYGDVEVTFKDSVRDRTTITFGDSLPSMRDKDVLPQPANAPPDYRSTGDKYMTGALVDPNQPLADLNDKILYVEAQIHGSLGLDDVASIRFVREDEPYMMEAYHAMAAERGVDHLIKTVDHRLDFKEFDPGQPRDESGKWTSDGGGGPMPPPPPKPRSTGATLSSLGIKATRDFERKATQQKRQELEELASKKGQTPEQVQKDIEDTMGNFLKGSKLRMNVPLEAFEKIFEPGGRFQNQLETGTSRGDYRPDSRLEVEGKTTDQKAFSVGENSDDHPKYGYVDNTGASIQWNMGAAYGGVAITFKDSVKDRTTLTFGDSLIGLVDQSVLPQPINAPPDYRAVDPYAMETLSNGVSPEQVTREIGYVEAQIHGPGLTPADVESVHFERQTSAVARLEQSGEIMRYIKLARDNGVKVV